MLNTDALQQLSQLKSSIRAQRELAQGLVRTTTRRFGFVRLDDGRDAFLDPEQMLRVLPGDRVEVELKTNPKGQLEARLERLLGSEFEVFVGRYVRKGQAHFAEPDSPNFNRWLFIAPAERGQCTEGDYVLCRVLRHPFANEGKAQVGVSQRIGKPDEPGIEARYIAAKHQLPSAWPTPAEQQASAITGPVQSDAGLDNLCHLPFVTIDAESTRDMDDALYVEQTDNGWELITAIADPSRYIAPDSPLAEAARERATSVYLLGHTLTMLPPELSHDTLSLVPEQRRPALISRIRIDQSGAIENYQFSQALICSQYKLSYQGVSDLLAGEDSYPTLPHAVKDMLAQLQELAQVRMDYRREHALVMEERADYFHLLNDQRKIERIEKRERTQAHRMVEEAMLATNICAGELLRQHPGYGIFSSHIGFRAERMAEVLSLLAEDVPELTPGDLSELDNFRHLMRTLRQNSEQNPRYAPLLSVLQRMLQAGSLSLNPVPHFGLGFDAYATVTSPIRRYHDYHNHLAIKAILTQQPAPALADADLDALQQRLLQGRNAARQLELWLCCHYLAEKIGSIHQGTIVQVNASGIGVRLEDIGVEGFVLLKQKPEGADAQPGKISFDARRLSLSTPQGCFRLDESVTVLVESVDIDSRRINLQLVDADTAARLSAWTQTDDQAPESP